MDQFEVFSEILRSHRQELEDVYGVKQLAIFGSTVRQEQTPTSDIDIVIDFDPSKGLFVFLDLKKHLEELLEHPVDLVTYRALHPALRDHILNEARDAF
ncbi:MAG: nucleotidyltransferase family protein [Chlamydiia bacterium]|nr:nucleotidyltransferase family protein [Chlamydiia bacterium]